MRTPLLATLSLLPLILISTRPAWADYRTGHADLICDPAHNIALARFIEGSETDPPKYAKMPPKIDHGLSTQTGTGRRVCKLANGWEIKLRNGVEQAFPYGMGGAAPPYFFSLWIDRHKVISRQNWSEENYAETEPQIAGVVITPTQVTTCAWKDGDDTKPLTCSSKPLNLNQDNIDTIEYSATFYRPTTAQLTVIPGKDESVCHWIIRHGPNDKGGISESAGEPDLPVQPADMDWIDTENSQPPEPWPFVASIKDTFGLSNDDEGPGGATTFFTPYAQDFDGDGKPDTVIERRSAKHSFDGSYYIVAPGTVPVINVLRTLYAKGADVDDIKHAKSLGWHVYSGGQPGLYPREQPHYVHIDRIWLGKDYLLAYPTSENADPTAIVIAPKPDGGFDTVCTIQRPRLNY
ncbi:MAG TPA: hypothetical protein VHZ32_07415 [Rhizomicrobium sp.]|jgi:hypothetical protein|nr:hypothetical protein [Rhizomicrobium sp.]